MVYGVCECAQATLACGGQATACVSASAFHLALNLEVLVVFFFFHCPHLRQPANFQGCPPVSNLLMERSGLRTCAAGSGFYVDSGYLNPSLCAAALYPRVISPQPQSHF